MPNHKVLSVLAMCIVWSLFATGCVGLSVDLEEKAAQVQLRHAENGAAKEADSAKSDVDGYEKVKYVRCELGANGRSDYSNEKACENYLRNEALRLKAELVVVDESHSRGESSYYGKTCNNCVVMSGWTYKKKTKNPEPRFEPKVDLDSNQNEVSDNKNKVDKILSTVSESSPENAAENEPFRFNAEESKTSTTPRPGSGNARAPASDEN